MNKAQIIANQIAGSIAEELHNCPDPVVDAAEIEGDVEVLLKGTQIALITEEGTFVIEISVRKE